MVIGDIRTRIWERLEEDATTPLRYPSATVTEYVQDGIRFYVARTGCQVATTTITQTASTLLYDLPCDCIQVERVLWDNSGVSYSLEPTHPRHLDNQWYLWQRQTDTRARAYFLLGLRKIALWPISTAGGESYVVHYQQDEPDDLTKVPVEDHECLVDYGLARCLLSEGKVEDGMAEYTKYRKAVEAATRRMASADRVWKMQRGVE